VDALGRVTARTDEAGETWSTEYDAAGNTVAEVDPLGYRTQVAYDLLGRPTAATDKVGATTHTTYDAVGAVTTRTDALGHEWQYTYDAMSRVLTATSPEGAVTSYAYDASGNQARVQNARGFVVETVFDGLGRPVRVTDPDAGVTTTGYDAVGRVTDVTDANGAVESWVYDGLGRTVQHVDGEGFATVYAYDAVGNLLTETGPRGGVTAYEYDAMNRPLTVVDAEDETTELSYDEAGNVVASVDPVGVQTRFVYDPRQLLVLTVENADLGHLPNSSTNVVTQTAYDARGDVVAVTDPRGNRTQYVRDALGRVVETTDAAGRVTGTGFDAAGRMVSESHADGTTTDYSYSPDGYLTQTQYTDQTVTYAVDTVGNRTTMTDAMGTSAWEFDWANRVVSDNDAHGATHTFTYDAVGNQVRAEYADGRVLERTFDGRGLTLSQSGPDGVTEFAYDADGNLTQTTRRTGVVTTTSYDLVSRATSIVHAGGTPEGFDGDVSPASGAPGNAFGHCNGAPGHVNQEPTGCWSGELSFTYDYDARGLVVQRTVTTDEGVTVTDYAHDALGRLTESVSGDYTATYGWDAGSNLVNESVSDDVATNLADDGWVIDRDVNQVNQVTSVVTDGRLPVVHTLTESLTYDARGNRTGSVTTRTTGNKTHDLARVDYTFDGMNQLVGVWDHGDNLNNVKDDQVTAWSRDGLGRGLTVTENGTTKSRVFDGTALIVDGDTRVTFGPDGRVLNEAFETVEGHGKNATEVTITRDVLTDLLGSAVGVAQDGIVNADLAWFGDFGDTLSAPEWDTVTSFTGHVETAGLTEFATRTYDPATRVWVQEDSYSGTVTRASSLNRYAYVEGSPASHTDVLGAFRAASAMAAQKLTAAEYAEFIQWFAILSVIGRYNEWQTNLAVLRQAAADEEYYHAVAGIPMPGEEYQDRGFWGNTGAFISGWAGQAWNTGVGVFDLALVAANGTSGWAQYTGSAERVDQMYESFMFGVEDNGWWAQSNIAFNPVYHLIDAGDNVSQACGAGDWSQCGSSTFDFQMAEVEVALIAYGGAKSISPWLPGAKPPVVVPGAKPPVVLTGEAATANVAADSALPGLPASAPKPLGLGSTGRTAPANLTEQLAMTEVRADPSGRVLGNIAMGDTRWPAVDGWVKIEQRVNGVTVHYVKNTVTGAVDDFKFIGGAGG